MGKALYDEASRNGEPHSVQVSAISLLLLMFFFKLAEGFEVPLVRVHFQRTHHWHLAC